MLGPLLPDVKASGRSPVYRRTVVRATAWRSGPASSSRSRRWLIRAATSTGSCRSTPRSCGSTSSRAGSGHDRRASGVPVSAGKRQARALASATCSAMNDGGRPDRSRSIGPPGPRSANRLRQQRTVSRCKPVSRAMRALERPRAATAPPARASAAGTPSCGRRPSAPAARARRRVGLSGVRRQRARRADRLAVVDLAGCLSLMIVSPAVLVAGGIIVRYRHRALTQGPTTVRPGVPRPRPPLTASGRVVQRFGRQPRAGGRAHWWNPRRHPSRSRRPRQPRPGPAGRRRSQVPSADHCRWRS